MNQICDKFGLNNIMAQLYAMLYLSDKALSLDELADRLKVSKGSSSINIRALEEYGAVKRIWVKGSRKNYYEEETNIAKVILDRIKSMSQRRLLEIEETLDTSYKILDTANTADKRRPAEYAVLKDRLDKLRSFHTQAKSLLDLLNSGLLNNILHGYLAKEKR